MTKLEIKILNCPTPGNAVCPICKEIFCDDVGPWACLHTTFMPVCEECVKYEDYELYNKLKEYQSCWKPYQPYEYSDEKLKQIEKDLD